MGNDRSNGGRGLLSWEEGGYLNFLIIKPTSSSELGKCYFAITTRFGDGIANKLS